MTYLLDIPIYWCEEASFNARYEKKLRTYEERTTGDLRAKGLEYEPSEEDRRLCHSILWEKSMGPWRFNQIVGWVRVYRLGNKLQGEHWSIKAKRFSWQLRKKRFIHHGKAFEIWPSDEETSEQIFNRLGQRLRRFKKELRGPVIDLESFENLGRFVDWRRLIDTVNR
ncbi:MAG: hypothetical protein ACREX3_12515 [Gammaproteobacteria bacterium]